MMQIGPCTEFNPTGTKLKEKKKHKFRENYIPNNLGGDQRSKRRYPVQLAIAPHTAMISNLVTHPSHAPIKRRTTMKQQPPQTEWGDT